MNIDWGDAPAWAATAVSGPLALAALIVSIKALRSQRRNAAAAEVSADATIRSANAAERPELVGLADTVRHGSAPA
jgi:hypothetical protein